MEVLTEMDEYFNAMAKINMDEPVMPYVKGRLVESDTYNKVQKILNTPELEKAHMYCYDLDLENLEECDVAKINNLYKLGVERGFIDDDFQYQDRDDADCCKAEEVVVAEPKIKQNPRAKIPCFVAMYSAMKDGQIRTGEAYSRAISVQAAKSDVLNQLSKLGYSNISILAVEATEEDACCSSCCGAAEEVTTPSAADLNDEIKEDDYLKGRTHNNHLPEAEEVEKDDSSSNENDDSGEEASDDSDKDADSDAENADTEDDSVEDGDSEDDDGVADNEDNTDSEDDPSDDDAEDDEDASEASEDDDSEDDSEDDDSEDDSEDDDSEDDSEDDDSEDDSEDDDSEDDSEDDDSEDEPEELDDNKKADLKDSYKRIFKNTMLKCKFEDKTFDDLTIAEKVKFFTELSKIWKEDHEPFEFMSDKEIDQLNKIAIKK